MAEKDIIVYNFSYLRTLSNRMNMIVDTLSVVEETIRNCTNSINEHWQGQAYEAFSNRVSGLNGSLEKLYEQVKASKDKLDKAIAAEEANEQNIKDKIVDELTADNIF